MEKGRLLTKEDLEAGKKIASIWNELPRMEQKQSEIYMSALRDRARLEEAEKDSA